MGTRLSLRPDLDQDVGLLALYVSGNLPNAKPEVAYEGRLKIHNAEGACTAEQIGGDILPPGSSVFVDNATKQVVVAWPAYAEFVTPLQNPSFESGDLSGWTLTPKGGAATATADTSQKFDGAYSLRWPGGKGLGSEGGIEVEAWNNTIGPCLPGQRVTSHARCMYNPGGHNFGSRYQGLLRFLDGAGMPIGPAVRGRQFKGRGENGRWNDASATGVGPVGTKGVQMGAWLTGSNAPVWLDAASWDVPSSVGINIETTLNITLRVRDSAGRTVLWSGSVVIRDASPQFFFDISTAPIDGAMTLLNDGTSVLVTGGDKSTFRAVRSSIYIPDGDYYFESDTRGSRIVGGTVVWGVIGVCVLSGFNNGAHVGTYPQSAGCNYSVSYAGDTFNWSSIRANNVNAGEAYVWSPIENLYQRARHRLTVIGGIGHYQIAREGGAWFTAFTGVSGPFSVVASLRGPTIIDGEPVACAHARLFSVADEFMYPVPSGCVPLSVIVP